MTVVVVVVRSGSSVLFSPAHGGRVRVRGEIFGRDVENNGGVCVCRGGGVSINAKGVRSAWTTTRGRNAKTGRTAGFASIDRIGFAYGTLHCS